MRILNICGITVALVSKQSTELCKGPEAVLYRLQNYGILSSKNCILKVEVVSSTDVVSSRFRTTEYCLPKQNNEIEVVSSHEDASSLILVNLNRVSRFLTDFTKLI